MRFPGYYSVESLPVIGRERRIRRGRIETHEVYATRLRRWLDDHRRRGGPYALLAQLHAHFAPDNFPIALVYRNGRRFAMKADGTVTRDVIAWEPDHEPAKWARWWLIYQWPEELLDDGHWGDPGTWGDGGVWGSSLSPQQVTDLRLVPKEWNAAHCFGRLILVEGGELWGFPSGTWGDPGTWGGGSSVQLAIG
jgi:hypothetical protein